MSNLYVPFPAYWISTASAETDRYSGAMPLSCRTCACAVSVSVSVSLTVICVFSVLCVHATWTDGRVCGVSFKLRVNFNSHPQSQTYQ
jgi:hypothetical protein